jgi:putative endonuclease
VERRVDRHARGRDAEDLAADHLVREGFAILWRNVRIGALEVDIVAQKDDLVVIVEVRARGEKAFARPLASITWSKRLALLRAARGLWRGRLKKRAGVQRVRIDVIAVTCSGEDRGLEWIRGAITDG